MSDITVATDGNISAFDADELRARVERAIHARLAKPLNTKLGAPRYVSIEVHFKKPLVDTGVLR